MNTKRFLITTILLFNIVHSYSQTISWEWAKSAQNNSKGNSMCVETDKNSNAYITGYYSNSSITFDSITLLSNGSDEIFIVKYDCSGNVVWAKSIGSSGSDSGTSLTTDEDGCIYITGIFRGPTIVLDSIVLNNVGTVNTIDCFVAKYNSSGNVIWAKRFGGNSDDSAGHISLDNEGNILLTGSFKSDSISFGSTYLINNAIYGGSDIIIAKLDSCGNEIWSRNTDWVNPNTISYWNSGYSIKSDNINNVYVIGSFKATNTSNGSIAYGNDTLVWSNYTSLEIIKYDKFGNEIWARSAKQTGTGFTDGNNISIDSTGNIYILGQFGHATNDLIIFDSDTLRCKGSSDIYIAKLNSSGNIIWAKNFGGNNGDNGFCLIIDRLSNIYITGVFLSDSINFDNITLYYHGYYDIFFVKLDLNGNVIKAGNYGSPSPNFNMGLYLASDTSNNIFMTGCYGGNINIGSNILTSLTDQNPFLAKTGDGLFINNHEIIENNVILYPIPTHDILNINLKTMTNNFYIEIFDLKGQNIYNKKLTSIDKKQINLSSLSKGLYFIKIYNDKNLFIEKIIKD